MSARPFLSALLACAAVPAIAQTTPAAAPAAAPAAMSERDLANQQVIQSLYPARAKAAGEQGIVGFKVRLDSQGQPTECVITQSSGFPRLDDETCSLIVLRTMFSKPGDASRSSAGNYHEGRINWTLPGSTASVPKPVAMASADSKRTKLICRRAAATGSIVARERVCLTREQWDRESAESKQPWEEQQGRGWKAGE
jgi:TonB family protein